MSAIFILPLISLFSPFPILVIERIFPIPSIIEEIFTVLIVLAAINFENKTKKNLFSVVVFSGIIFSISESILYLNNILILGSVDLFVLRLLFTTLVHTSNFILIYLFAKKGFYWLVLGFLIAVLLHYLYNNFLVYFIVNKLGF